MVLSLCRWAQIYGVFVVVLASLSSGPVFAIADGPDYYRVVDVTDGNVLNVRANFECIGGLTLTEYEAATAAERAAARKTRWCRVGYDRTIGWVAGWFLAEGRSKDSFSGGAALGSLAGSEWQVRDFAGKPTNVEAWIAFKADGTVSGLGGCNQFNGGYTENSRSLRFGPIAATRMACPTPNMRVEVELFKTLEATHEIVATNLLLALFDDNATLLATLTRRDWD
jgi:heat shock protein HslJ